MLLTVVGSSVAVYTILVGFWILREIAPALLPLQ